MDGSYPVHARRQLLLVPVAWDTLLVTIAATAAAWRMAFTPVDPDYWWHLAAGRWMVEHGRVPTSDPFSFTHAGQSWYAHEWLGELIIAVIDRIGGYAAVIAITALIVAVAAWLCGRSARWFGIPAPLATAIVLFWGVFVFRFVTPRPQVWGWAFVALLLHEIAAFESGQRRRLWHLTALFVLWINIHLSALIGLLILGLYAVHVAIRRLSPGIRESRVHERPLSHIAAVLALSAAALLVNPCGPSLLWFARVYGDQSAVFYRYIGEWQHLRFIGVYRGLIVAGAALICVALLRLVRSRSLWPEALAIIFAVAAVRAGRNVPLFCLVAVPVSACCLAPLVHHRPALWLGERAVDLRPRVPVALLGVVPALAIIWPVSAHAGSQFRRSGDASRGGYPVGAVAWLQTHLLQDGRTDRSFRLFNEYGWGGYLIESLYPSARVYIDGRAEMYGSAFFARYISVMSARSGWRNTLAGAGIDAIVISPRSYLGMAILSDGDWQVAYRDSDALLLVPAQTAAGGR